MLSSPVLVIDALGFADRIRTANAEELAALSERLNRQYHRFKSKAPHKLVVVFRSAVWGTREFRTLRLNDMFILHADGPMPDPPQQYTVASLLLYQTMLLEGFVPRGGLGYGLILRKDDSLIGSGFLDAYAASEKREDDTRHICAVRVSLKLVGMLPPGDGTRRLLCFYKNALFLHPWGLVDPDLGAFDKGRVMRCLRDAGANNTKLSATEAFLENFEDYNAARLPGSASREFFDRPRTRDPHE